MRKGTIAGMLLFLLLLSTSVFAEPVATIPGAECRLGAVRLGMSYEDLIRLHGIPVWKSGDREKGVVTYGKNVRIGIEKGVVEYVYTRANNGWRTPSGLKVGMDRKDVFRIYGQGNPSGSGSDYQNYCYWLAEAPGIFAQDTSGGYLVIASSKDAPEKVAYIELTRGGYWFESFSKKHFE